MNEYKLRFKDKQEAVNNLHSRFFNGKDNHWDGNKSPFYNNDLEQVVVVREPVRLDENGNRINPTWVGFHVDMLAKSIGDLSEFEISVDSPYHKFG